MADGFTPEKFVNELHHKILKGETIKRVVIFVRGLPGSGKTYWTHLLFKKFQQTPISHVVMEPQDYWRLRGREYDRSELSTAHKWTQENFQMLVRDSANSADVIVLTNGFTELFELKAYLRILDLNKFDVYLVECELPTSMSDLEKMKNRSPRSANLSPRLMEHLNNRYEVFHVKEAASNLLKLEPQDVETIMVKSSKFYKSATAPN